ncbi:conserved hypothetical protein [Magnetospirillum sp. LM-5]|uniref:hypothetical protein n=1 Tax=Magnetospirillum sp. LM-5 TaxID=2681466 RepID=UPI0013836A12|nr:hypothetical protein [Magnetospirillum sp. LM-5]CAA7622225.1 conserved hypothetical protein [Magnetospirillum sp. LM-5]
MRILVAIPHFYRAGPVRALHASGRAVARDTRRRALARSILQLKGLFGDGVAFGANYADRRLETVPAAMGGIDVALVTDGRNHLIDGLNIPPGWFHHLAVPGDPRHLGFACHRFLAENASGYDFVAYVEDDILIHDPLFFHKLSLFNQAAGNPRALLVPHRFEVPIDLPQASSVGAARIYPDLSAVTASAPHDPQRLTINWLGRPAVLEVARNVHSGCWALTRDQMALFVANPTYQQTEPVWVTPLDMAASYTIRAAFRVFKPTADSVFYLEVEHASPLVASQIDGREADGRPRWRPQEVPKAG